MFRLSTSIPVVGAIIWAVPYTFGASAELTILNQNATFGIARCWPWSTAHAELPLGFRVTSDAQPTTLPAIIPGVLVRNDGNSATNIQGASISGALFDRATDPRSRQTSHPSTLQTLK